jgi:tyrosine-specific transport protein
MIMHSKILGGILLVVGTTIGGGMLALPVVLAQSGIVGAVCLLIASWAVMAFCALLILEVNLWMPEKSNIILMAKTTLGIPGEAIAWICYLLLFYCLLAAYIAGGSDILHGLLDAAGVPLPLKANDIFFTLLFGLIVYKGIKIVDYTNRGLMFIKMGAFLLLILSIVSHIDIKRYHVGHIKYLVPAVTVVLTSFGFSNIIPSLRSYFDNDIAKLRKVIIIGSLIPLFCYIAWIAAIFGGIPFQGEHSLMSIVHAEHSTLALTQALIYHINNTGTTSLTRLFTSVCVLTSFLSVSLCVVDFLADGFRMQKHGRQKVLLHLATFIPPLLLSMLYPTAFIIGLNYAGVCLSILIVLLPVLMVWKGRYIQKLPSNYQVMGGKLPLILVAIVALFVVYQGLFWSK